MKPDIPKQKKKGKKVNVRWIGIVFFSAVVISAIFSMVSDALLTKSSLIPALGILLVIILIGIVFDMIGVAVTAADTKPFHSMAAHRVPGAQEALTMLRNAEKVSSFCNDVVGDICGVISGTASASIVVMILAEKSAPLSLLEILMAALVSGITVGGKAIGKGFAISRSTQIVHATAKVIYYVKYAPKAISKLWSKK